MRIKGRRNAGTRGCPLVAIVLLLLITLNLALLYWWYPRNPRNLTPLAKVTPSGPATGTVNVPSSLLVAGGRGGGADHHANAAFFHPPSSGRTYFPNNKENDKNEVNFKATPEIHPRDPGPAVVDTGNEEGGGEEDISPQPPFYVRDRAQGWSYDTMESMLSSTISKKHWRPTLAEKPSTYEAARKLEGYTGCDILTVPFLAANDKRCLKFLTNPANWKELQPLDMKYDERTIKFKIIFNIPESDPLDKKPIHKLETILKVPQRLFPNEAFSEVASYHADRVLQINRVPPTGWVCIPSTMVHKAVNKYAATVQTVDEFLKDSGVKNYTDWIDKDMFQFAKYNKGLLATTSPYHDNDSNGGGEGEDHPGGEECVGASIQLFMADVGHLLDSVLKIPYIPHNASWMRYFDLTHKSKPEFLDEKWAVSMVHLSEIATYDYIIGNGDRSPNKNNFVVGGCRGRYCGRKADPPHPGWPTYVHLDQGMGFYGSPHGNAISKGAGKMCIFRTPLLNRVKELVETAAEEDLPPVTPSPPGIHPGPGATKRYSKFHVALAKALPKPVLAQVNQYRLGQATERMHQLLKIADKCLSPEHRSRHWVLAP